MNLVVIYHHIDTSDLLLWVCAIQQGQEITMLIAPIMFAPYVMMSKWAGFWRVPAKQKKEPVIIYALPKAEVSSPPKIALSAHAPARKRHSPSKGKKARKNKHSRRGRK